MSDIVNSLWEPIAAANIHPSPDGVAKEDAPNAVPEVMREMKAATKRFYQQINALSQSTGSGNAYVLTYPQAPEGYAKGIRYIFFADKANSGAATLNINGLGDKQILQRDGAALGAGQIVSGSATAVIYDGAAFRLENYISNPKFSGTLEADNLAVAGAIGANSLTAVGLAVSGPAGADRTIHRRTDGKHRWAIYENSAAETGDNVGSDFAIARYTDTGNYISIPLSINRRSGDVTLAHTLSVAGGNIYLNSSGNTHQWYQQNGVARALTYYNAGDGAFRTQLYNSSGNYTRQIAFKPDGEFRVEGHVAATAGIYGSGELGIGDARFYADGNIKFAGNMASTYGAYLSDAISSKQNALGFNPVQQGTGFNQTPSNTIKIGWSSNSKLRLTIDESDFGWRWPIDISGMSTSLKEGGSDRAMTFNWNGQGGQPDWLWGGNDGTNMYVFSPNNFSVKNAAQLGGLAASDYATKTYVASNSPSLGIQQRWYAAGDAAIGNRSVNTIYQNTSGKAIAVFTRVGDNGVPQVSHNGSNWINFNADSYSNVTLIVPPSHYYRVNGGAYLYWHELR